MPRFYNFKCTNNKCDFQEVRRLNYTKQSNAKEIGPGRYSFDFSIQPDHDGYPDSKIDCPKCGNHIDGYHCPAMIGRPFFINILNMDD